ncbi:MAG: NAAT family transporter [Candidatus Methanoperedens sp.]|nr:NAAT family transporter [Candidatus Methanoperedens sp.]MCE8424465.1 NAAT family transporter [Candidatus Methanoperedens sp.]MCE8426984.1 NAAT family transporter [Candidatus Methanoperedens sp.]
MTTNLTFFIYAFTSIFAIVNPVSGVMTFVSITARMNVADKIYVARRSVVIACVVALIFSISGEYIIKMIFNITVDHLRVAGGVLLFLVAIDMLFGRTTRESITTEELKDAANRDDISIFPMAMPMLTGPGAITTTILVTKAAGDDIFLKLVVIAAILLTFIITFIILRYSDFFNRTIGLTGMMVMTRLMGLFLGAIAVDFISMGIKGIYIAMFSGAG